MNTADKAAIRFRVAEVGKPLDAEIACSGGYAISQQKRKLIEQGFGWAKDRGAHASGDVRGLKAIKKTAKNGGLYREILDSASFDIILIMRSLSCPETLQ